MRPAGCGFRREPGAALKKNGPTRLGLGRAKVGFAHAPVQEQGDVKHIARRMSRDQLIRCDRKAPPRQRGQHSLYCYAGPSFFKAARTAPAAAAWVRLRTGNSRSQTASKRRYTGAEKAAPCDGSPIIVFAGELPRIQRMCEVEAEWQKSVLRAVGSGDSPEASSRSAFVICSHIFRPGSMFGEAERPSWKWICSARWRDSLAARLGFWRCPSNSAVIAFQDRFAHGPRKKRKAPRSPAGL